MHTKLLGPCFKTGQVNETPRNRYRLSAIQSAPFAAINDTALPLLKGHRATEMRRIPSTRCFVHPLTFRRFQFCLTLFSEYFAMFPRGTSLLSNTSEMFSFRWKLPPIVTLLSKSETPIHRTICKATADTGLSPTYVPFSKQFSALTTAGAMYEHYNSMASH